MRSEGRRLCEHLLPLLGLSALVGLWWVFTGPAAGAGTLLARLHPRQVVGALVEMVASGAVVAHGLASLGRIAMGLALATLVGFPLGLALGSLPALARLLGPLVQLARTISPLAWTPLAIMLFGVGSRPVIFLVAVACLWPVAINTAAGVERLDGRWVLVARSLGADRWEVLRTAVWPVLRPHVLTGLRLAVGLAWVVVVPAEMLGVNSGLGYFILDTRDRLAYDELVATLWLIGGLGMALEGLARRLLEPGHRP